MEFDPLARKEMSFKDISYLELCSADKNFLCNFNRRHHEEQFCELTLNMNQWFRRKCRLRLFLIWSILFCGVEPSMQF